MKRFTIAAVTMLLLITGGCDVVETITNLGRCQFKMGDANQVMLAGVSIDNKNNLEDFSLLEIADITSAFASGSIPVTCILNIEAKNPNDGSGGYKRTSAQITSFPYRLLLNNKSVVWGGLADTVGIPGTGEIEIIPLAVSFDIYQFFSDGTYEDIINVALILTGSSNSAEELSLWATPSVSTSLGELTYPDSLQVVQTAFTSP